MVKDSFVLTRLNELSPEFNQSEYEKFILNQGSREVIYKVWDRVCQMYEKKLLGTHQLHEIYSVVKMRMNQIKKLEKALQKAGTK